MDDNLLSKTATFLLLTAIGDYAGCFKKVNFKLWMDDNK